MTALVFVIVMLAGLFMNAFSFIFLFIFIMAGCLYEFVKILKKIKGNKFMYYLPLALIYIILPLLMMIDLGISGNIFLKDQIILDDLFYSPLIPCGILFSIWINDTMAYLVGSFIGKTPFSKISPKKTWEGTIGGIILCIVVISLAGYYVPVAKTLHWQQWLCLAAICAVFGTAGDLLESKLKRVAGIKDSGNLMPGHGGFLDRFDSLLVATPFVWGFIKFLF